MKIKIIDDGMCKVKIIDIETGVEIKGVIGYTVTRNMNGIAIAKLEFRNVEFEINAKCVDK